MTGVARRVRDWQLVDSQPLADYPICRVRHRGHRSLRTGAEHELFVLQMLKWATAIAGFYVRPLAPGAGQQLLRAHTGGLES